MPRVMLIGATGTFGRRLARALAGIGGLDLIVTSRSLARSQTLKEALGAHTAAGTELRAERFEHGPDSATRFAALRPWLVIDASGPFQTASYAGARAAIEAGAHWIDLADDAGYILGFAPALDALARARGVTAMTGASSTPALSFAVVQHATAEWRRIESVDIAIYPAGGGDVGRAVIEAVLSYAGRPVAAWRSGALETRIGWASVERVSVPGLGQRLRSPVATADYALLPAAFGAANVSFHAGLESRLEHRGLALLARMRARGLIRDTAPLAGLLHTARALTRPFCGSRGAMTVEIRGVDGSGKDARVHWWLLAREGDGPTVPVLPALALTKKLLSQSVEPQASCAVGTLRLADIEAEMTRYALTTSTMAA